MYKTASRNSQYAATHVHFSELSSGEQNLTDQEKYDALKSAYTRLIEINKSETDKKLKKIYGQQLQDMTKELGFYRDKLKASKPVRQISDYIIQIFKEKCSPEQWKEVREEAKKRALA